MKSWLIFAGDNKRWCECSECGYQLKGKGYLTKSKHENLYLFQCERYPEHTKLGIIERWVCFGMPKTTYFIPTHKKAELITKSGREEVFISI